MSAAGEAKRVPVVLDVGQCDFDHGSIRQVCEKLGAVVERAHTGPEALARVAKGGVSLVLVNRVLDCDGSDGVALIPEVLKSAGGAVTAMLVSNYTEYQHAAMRLGAAQGFGKSQLHEPETAQLLRHFLVE